ncbi:hypothetical protein ASE38_01595 [Cellulomonas sp. Root930]|nr:hypothetical protein ASE38_01595 [Cellulomonas sp. Root930]
MITVETAVPPHARPGGWVRVHEIDLPGSLRRLPIGEVVIVRDLGAGGDRRAVVDKVDRDDRGRRYWLLLIAPRVGMREVRRNLGALVDYVVATGERITITRRGRPVAHMIKWPGPLLGEPGDDEDVDLS